MLHEKVVARCSINDQNFVSEIKTSINDKNKEIKAMKEKVKINIKEKPSEEKAVYVSKFIYKMILILP